MAAGWPTKVTYANGDVYSASDVNDTNGTLNYINPTSATDNQVLTRDNAAPGKVKWANSPANTLTTTGDLYYASAANTPARLPIGSTNQVLTVAGGVPTWGSATGGWTTIASGTLSGTLSLSSITGAYKDLKLQLFGPQLSAAGGVTVTINGASTGYSLAYYDVTTGTPVLAGFTTSSINIGYAATTGSATYMTEIVFPGYSSSVGFHRRFTFLGATFNRQVIIGGGSCSSVTSAITTIASSQSFTGGSYQLLGI